MTPSNGLFSSFALITLLVYHVNSAPFASLAPRQGPAAGQTYVNIGQNYFSEWEGFATTIKTPAGISVYGDIYAGALNPDSVDLLSRYAGQHSSVLFLWSPQCSFRFPCRSLFGGRIIFRGSIHDGEGHLF